MGRMHFLETSPDFPILLQRHLVHELVLCPVEDSKRAISPFDVKNIVKETGHSFPFDSQI